MSPAVKSKSKSSAKIVKEQQQKAPSKLLTAPVNGGNSLPGGAYNPLSGTFHNLETTSPAPSSPPQNKGRFQTIDEGEEHSGSSNGTPEYDSVSNGSCSGESEDQKDKAVASTKPRREAIPGSDLDKRDKIRQKNEKKHQRQRERRAQELHDRCTGYLMSRKLEVLAQQLVAMGFPSERATTALILNEGRVEQSVAWLFEGGEGEQCNVRDSDSGSSMKIDISDELARMADMEMELKCSKQEVERAIVSCEGDMEKAAEILKAQKQEMPVSPCTRGAPGEAAAAIGGERKVAMSGNNTIGRTPVKAVNSVSQQQPKTLLTGAGSLDSRGRNLQTPRLPPKVESSSGLQVTTVLEKRWPSAASNPSVSISHSPAAHPSLVGAEARYAVVSSEMKTKLQAGALREPVVVMQRPQPSVKQNLLPTATAGGLAGASPVVTSGWYPAGVSNLDAVKVPVGGLQAKLQNMNSTTSGTSSAVQYNMRQHQSLMYGSADTAATGWGDGPWSLAGTTSGTSSSSSLTVPSSLGLFTGWGSSGSSSPVDWSTGGAMMHCDYASIDWSLDSTPAPLQTPKTDRDWLYDAWATTLTRTGKFGRMGLNGGACIAGLHDNGLAMDSLLPAGGSHEWTSPFAGKDIFSLPRRFVTSPSM